MQLLAIKVADVGMLRNRRVIGSVSDTQDGRLAIFGLHRQESCQLGNDVSAGVASADFTGRVSAFKRLRRRAEARGFLSQLGDVVTAVIFTSVPGKLIDITIEPLGATGIAKDNSPLLIKDINGRWRVFDHPQQRRLHRTAFRHVFVCPRFAMASGFAGSLGAGG